MSDKQKIREENELNILEHLHRFGWLTTRMVSALVWPNASQGESMARRTLKRLADSKLILRRPLSSGKMEVYTLSTSGAKQLRDVLGISAISGNKLPLANPIHRACANWYLIRKLSQGFTVRTEYEIQTGRAPWGIHNGKTADGLVETELGVTWVEVENSWKNRARRETIIRFVEQGLGDPENRIGLNGGKVLFRVAVVATNEDALRSITQTFKESLDHVTCSLRLVR